jgi:hypothetical protein
MDLLATWRLANNFTLQLPDLTIWRIHIRVTIRFNFASTTVQAAQGAHVSIYCDDRNERIQATTYTGFLNPYSNNFLMWDQMYTADLMQGAGDQVFTLNTTQNYTMTRSYDVKSHRRLRNQEETLWLDVSEIGTISINEISFQQSTLLRLPR